ncbi:MAG: asparaginase domain-containing protein [Chloroflexota bacterium]|nr:asparaginase domain-containing protein [Chloroflexota bacterium]MDE2883787.1 asparaginase domain-containing protein [Chloroflexota bacterium]
MAKPRIAVFSGPTSTVANSPTLVTSRKARLPGDRPLEGRYDHLAAQVLYEPVTVRVRRYSAHPLEADAKHLYVDDGTEYYEVELRPEDGPYLLPYMGRRADGTEHGAPFEEADLHNPALGYGGRQFFYPDASRVFEEIDRTVSGRDGHGEGNILDRMADFSFVRALPPGGYTGQGEVSGVDYFPYKPFAISHQAPPGALARVTNTVAKTLSSGDYAGAIWLEGSPTVEETTYWLSIVIGSDLPVVGVAAQRPHGELANDGDRNIVDAVTYIVSGQGNGMGAVGILDQQIFAARELKKGDARPGGYKATGGHGGVLGTIGPPVTLWYAPTYKRGATSDVRVDLWPDAHETVYGPIPIKDADGALLPSAVPYVHVVKSAAYMSVDPFGDPDAEVDIIARIEKGVADRRSVDPAVPKLHGFVMEGLNPYGSGTDSQMSALRLAAFHGIPTVTVGRADPGGRVPQRSGDVFVQGSNLDANKARLLLMASLLKLGPLPVAKDPRNPTADERRATLAKVGQFQAIFETH